MSGEVHILLHGWTLCGEFWPLRSERLAQWVAFNARDPEDRDHVTCAPCLVAAGQYFWEHGWPALMFGPHGWGRCCFCGKYGDESTMDPLSGGEQGCFDCVGNYLDRLRTDGIEVIDRGEVDL